MFNGKHIDVKNRAELMKHVIDEVSNCCAANRTDEKEHDTFIDKYLAIYKQMKRIDSHECPANEDSSAVGVKEVCENTAHKHTQLYLHKMDTEGKHG